MAHDNRLELHGEAHSDPQNSTRVNWGPVKQRNRVHSCDLCRQKKSLAVHLPYRAFQLIFSTVRCKELPTTNALDGCSNCATFGLACTYSKPQKKRGPKATRVEELTKENTSLKRENASLKDRLRSLSMCSRCFRPLHSMQEQDDSPRNASIFQTSTPETAAVSDTGEPSDDQAFTGDDLAEHFGQFSFESMKIKHFGSASTFALANSIAIKEQSSWQTRANEFHVFSGSKKRATNSGECTPDTSHFESPFDGAVGSGGPTLQRHEIRRNATIGVGGGGQSTLASKHFLFPYTVLTCASQYSDDPRVFVDGHTPLSAGWEFANEAWRALKLSEPTIHEVQMYFMLTLYAKATSTPQISWSYLGLGIRCLQQRAEFRRKSPGGKPGLEDELWKRVFWYRNLSFVIFDRMNCVFLGRPISLQPEDHDVDLPLEVDEEYWDRELTQPIGKPSQLSFFTCHVRLSEIVADALRKLYGSKRSKKMMGYDGPEWEQRTVAKLDSAMNDFVDSIPPHLRWDPENPPEGVFFDQAATLQIAYNHILIVIHRPNIQRVNIQGAPSLSICARAARTIIRTADIWLRKLQRIPPSDLINAVFLSGVTLILCTLGTKRAGLLTDRNNDLVRVETAMEILRFAASRVQPSGRLRELLQNLRSLDGGTPESNPEPSLPSPPSIYHAQYSTLWTTPSSDQSPVLRPGMSIEQLLASVGEPSYTEPSYAVESILDDQLMSIWMSGPATWREPHFVLHLSAKPQFQQQNHCRAWDAHAANHDVTLAALFTFGYYSNSSK
ncbi:hypothetical protein B0H14DRAFT_2573833 [Mycena olivaceomarginata]|nr:hypothetical protein B0H14DRAFT_2573833 [Mycena olivaceomarginata]